MADLSELQAAQTVKIAGASTAGAESNFLDVDVSGNAKTVVNNASGASAVNIQDGGNSITVDGTVSVSGSVAVTGPLTDAQLRATAVPVSGTFFQTTQPVSIAATVTVTGPLTDTQLRATAVPVSGTVTSNIGTTNGLALDTTLTGGTQKTKLVDTGGTNVASISASGALKIDGSAVTQPVSGTFFQATQPVSGTVTANQGTAAAVASAWTAKITDGTNTAAVKAASTAPVAADPAVVMAISPNSTLPFAGNRTGIGTIVALNGTIAANALGLDSVVFQVTGTFVSTIAVEGTVDGSTWFTIIGTVIGQEQEFVVGFASAPVVWSVPCGGYAQVRLRAVSFTSGTVSVNWAGDNGSFGYHVHNLDPLGLICAASGRSPHGSAVVGNPVWIGGSDGTVGRIKLVDTSGRSIVVGGAAAGSAASGAPVLMGGTDGSVIRNTLTDTSGRLIMVGTAADGAAIAGNPVLTAGYDGTNTQTILTDTSGRSIVSTVDGQRTTYSAAVASLVPATTPTDVFTITGSATKTVRILRIAISGTQTAAAQRDILFIKRSTANTAGTSAAATRVPHDSANAAATATVLSYTANPTLGTTVGTVRSRKLLIPTAATVGEEMVIDFGTRNGQGLVLRGIAEVLAVNLNSVTSAGNSFDITVEWTEE